MIPIVFSTDHNFVMQTGVCIYSLLANATVSKYDIYVLINRDVNKDDKALLDKQVGQFPGHNISFIEIGDVFSNSYEVRDISTATYSRLLIPWLLPQFDTVIYSDVDIVFKMDLSLIPMDRISDYLVEGVPALGLRSEAGRKHIKALGIDPMTYINAGFIVLNCKRLREENYKEKFLEEAGKKYLYQDQDIINLTCKGNILLIDIGFNVTPRFYEIYDRSSLLPPDKSSYENRLKWISGHDCIIHYAGQKPWNTFTYAWREWWNAFSDSIFYDPVMELKVSGNIIRPSYSWLRILSFIKRKLFR